MSTTAAKQRWPLRCTANPALPAAGFCTSCHQPFSGKFLAVRTDGRAICHRCAAEDQVELVSTTRSDNRDPVLAEGWRKALLQVVLQPHLTFDAPYHGSVMPAVRFGYLCTVLGMVMWLGYAFLIDYDTTIALYLESVTPYTEQFPDADPERLARLVAWISLPIAAAFRMVIGTIFLHIGIRLVGAPKQTFDQHVRLFGLASISMLFCVIPRFGPVIAMVLWATTCLAFLRQRYAFGTFQSLLALLPAVAILSLFFPTAQ